MTSPCFRILSGIVLGPNVQRQCFLHQIEPWEPNKKKKEEKKNVYARLHPDSQSTTWVTSVISSSCWICHVLLASLWLSTGGEGVGEEGGSGTADEIHDSLARNLVDWLHIQENACRKRILNQHSLLPCQCRTEPKCGQNVSVAHPYKHFRQWDNYIFWGTSDELGNPPSHGDD